MNVDRWIIAGLIVAIAVLFYMHFSEVRAPVVHTRVSDSYETSRLADEQARLEQKMDCLTYKKMPAYFC